MVLLTGRASGRGLGNGDKVFKKRSGVLVKQESQRVTCYSRIQEYGLGYRNMEYAPGSKLLPDTDAFSMDSL